MLDKKTKVLGWLEGNSISLNSYELFVTQHISLIFDIK